ncbi:hypothetical protein ABBQ38_001794 [Trebouxia sp. C0009 RCD-2024]
MCAADQVVDEKSLGWSATKSSCIVKQLLQRVSGPTSKKPGYAQLVSLDRVAPQRRSMPDEKDTRTELTLLASGTKNNAEASQLWAAPEAVATGKKAPASFNDM